MSKKVLIISSSLRGGSNSECLAKECERGTKDAGHDVQFISLKGIVTGGGIGGVNAAPKHADVMKKAYELGNKL